MSMDHSGYHLVFESPSAIEAAPDAPDSYEISLADLDRLMDQIPKPAWSFRKWLGAMIARVARWVEG